MNRTHPEGVGGVEAFPCSLLAHSSHPFPNPIPTLGYFPPWLHRVPVAELEQLWGWQGLRDPFSAAINRAQRISWHISSAAKQGNCLYNPGFPCRSSEAGAGGGCRRINFQSPVRRSLGAPGGARREFQSLETALGMRKNSWQEQLPQSLVVLVPAGVSGAWAKLHGAARMSPGAVTRGCHLAP